MLGQKPNLSKRIREMRASIALQGLARTFYSKPEEERFNENRELLPQLREAVQEDTRVLGRVRKHELTLSEACAAEQPLGIALARPISVSVSSLSGTFAAAELLSRQGSEQVAQEKLRAEIYGRVNTCNMLLYQVKQRSRAKEQLQRRLQQLQDVRMDEKQHQAQVPGPLAGVAAPVVRTLESSIEKTQTKVHAGQKVTALYVAVRDALRKELAHLPLHLDVLSETAELQHGEVEDMELRASHGLRAARVAKEHKARMEAQFRAERELRARTLAARKERVDRRWLKEAEERLLKAQTRHDVARDLLSLPEQDPLVAAKPEATKSRLERDAWLTEKMEKAKAAVQCSCLWGYLPSSVPRAPQGPSCAGRDGTAVLHDTNLQRFLWFLGQKPPQDRGPDPDVPGRLLAQQKSLAALEQYLRGRQEKQQELKKALKELEMQRDELKFRQPADTSRGLEEELRTRLQWEEARLAERRAQLLRSQETLLDFANGLDSLWGRLRGITVPGQEHSIKAVGAHEKLQQCEQKLQYLVQRVAHLPPCSHSEDDEVPGGSIPAALSGDPHRLSRVAQPKPSSQLEDGGARGRSHGAAQAPVALGSTFVKVRQLLEKTLLNEPQNQKVSLEDVCMRVQDDSDFGDNQSSLVLSREDIKKQGLRLIESKKKSKRK
ncbi:coiled-coil domain-containing protein 183-like [Lathamus discolor]|uniref:coiled-coil domain-containing protein 183-like n=1 Tax=Lathamus discolor TaxID=678569 RepID=UPI0032B7E91A